MAGPGWVESGARKRFREKLKPLLHWAGKIKGATTVGRRSGEGNSEKPRQGERGREGNPDAKSK